MWIDQLKICDLRFTKKSRSPVSTFVSRNSKILNDMAYPARLVFTPFVVVVGSKYFLPVPECLIF